MSPYEESQGGCRTGPPCHQHRHLPQSPSRPPEPFRSPFFLGVDMSPLAVLVKRGLRFPNDGAPPEPRLRGQPAGSSRVPAGTAPSVAPRHPMPPRAAAAPHGFPCWQTAQMCQGTDSSRCCIPATSHQLAPTAPRTGALADGPHVDAEMELALHGPYLGLKRLHFLHVITSRGPHSLHRAWGDMHAPPPWPHKREESLFSGNSFCSEHSGVLLRCQGLSPAVPPTWVAAVPSRRLLSRREGTRGFPRFA